MKPRVLIVDDDEDIRRLFTEYLETKHDWDVVAVGNGADALRELDSSFQAVVLDELMPGLRGAEVLKKIRQRRSLEAICIVMMTATRDVESVIEAFPYRPHAYLLKPVHPDLLYRTLVTGIAEIRPSLRLTRVFLCHSSADKPTVRDLYQRLKHDGIDPWLDEEDLLPGQEWDLEIRAAVKHSDIITVCLSKHATTKAGYLQKEIKYALDAAEEQPEGSLFIIPLRLDECEVPSRLAGWQWIDYYQPASYDRLLKSIRMRAKALGLL
jgi:CheY-like chemotaxis protein